MAKRKAARRAKPGKTGRKAAARPAKRKASATKRAPAKKPSKKAAPKAVAKKKAVTRTAPKAAARKTSTATAGKVARLDRARRTLADAEPHSTPSSLDMDRRGSAARTGRAERAQSLREHHGMEGVTGGDPDVDIEDAYFTGEEAPGGDNPTPDQDVVEDIGKALGVTYNDNEELKGADKLVERDKHRWELDPASAEDFTEHDKD
jgi:Family of unknown function (DUF6335)